MHNVEDEDAVAQPKQDDADYKMFQSLPTTVEFDVRVTIFKWHMPNDVSEWMDFRAEYLPTMVEFDAIKLS